MQKTVYTYHPITRAYLGPLVLSEDAGDMDPLEPGRWLIPGDCLETAPPEAPPGKIPVALGGAWALQDIPEPAPEPEPAPLTPEQQMQALEDALEDYVDSVARAHGFRNMDRAVSYRGDPDPAVDAKAQALFLWRSAVWARAAQEKAAILAGEAEIPTREEALAMLPVLEMPS